MEPGSGLCGLLFAEGDLLSVVQAAGGCEKVP